MQGLNFAELVYARNIARKTAHFRSAELRGFCQFRPQKFGFAITDSPGP